MKFLTALSIIFKTFGDLRGKGFICKCYNVKLVIKLVILEDKNLNI